jgi:predicted MFS family arabinose efflux permease
MENSYTHHFFPALLGGLMIVFLVPNGPYRKQSKGINLSALIGVFENQNLRSAAFYFGHMGIIRFWAFTPLMLQTYNDLHPETTFNIPILSFLIIGIGGLCVLSGYPHKPSVQNELHLPFVSVCGWSCFSFLFAVQSATLFLAFFFLGMVVVADSPLLSTLVAQNAPAEIGTTLTIVNSIDSQLR